MLIRKRELHLNVSNRILKEWLWAADKIKLSLQQDKKSSIDSFYCEMLPLSTYSTRSYWESLQ